ncbi:hypothetical protein CRE_19359 [Caenorhabditis remanei]|uniref:Uncharacterized protein n=1 Tax=Caenorhabditis remanei TaxID=31234 RepID=E3N549_CAERE|nr:hypothetical protein CRE_24316 [Caenorhabditis remanei]EFO86997.1 hypothetical protein CRE_19359 [Caenorhabditis remanei]
MDQVILGLFGMILSTWVMYGCLIAWRFEFYKTAAIFIYHIFTLAMYFSYISFCNFLTNLYIRLPSENKPFSGFKLYVFLFGVFHTMVGVATVYITKIWPVCILLLIASFVFCIDAYSCFFTDTYMLCEHRTFKYEMKTELPIDGIICHVVVRRNVEKSKELPEGWQYEDELKLDNKWYQEEIWNVDNV